MSDNFLSQEEVDALLKGVTEIKMTLSLKKTRRVYVPITLRRKSALFAAVCRRWKLSTKDLPVFYA
jgi:flagellar motor switch protein FliM